MEKTQKNTKLNKKISKYFLKTLQPDDDPTLQTNMRSLLTAVILLSLISLSIASSKSTGSGKTYKLLIFQQDADLQCYDTWFTDYDFFDVACLKSIISRGLSFAIIIGSAALKVPQMYNFYKAKSTFGVSSTMLYLDVISFTPSPIYNFLMLHPFFTYGEQIIVLTQNIILIFMMWYYDKTNSTGKSISIALVYAAIVFGLFALPNNLWYAYPLIGAAAATIGRLPQMRDNYLNKHTGTLSAFTFVLNSLGGVARMFTTLNETGDKFIAASQLVGVSVSVVILVQIVMYYAKTKQTLEDRLKKK